MMSFLRGLCFAPVLLLASPLQAQNNYSYTVINRFYQSAAPNRREADVTVIRCGSGQHNSGKKYTSITICGCLRRCIEPSSLPTGGIQLAGVITRAGSMPFMRPVIS